MINTILRGDTATWSISIRTTAGTPQDLSGCTVWVTSKAHHDDADEEALYQHYIVINEAGTTTSAEGLAVGEGGVEAGILVQEITASESSAFPTGTYHFDVQVKLPNGKIYTPLKGKDRVVQDVTRSMTV